jgi:hypothetical protein
MQNTPAGPSTLAARARSVVLPQQLQPVRPSPATNMHMDVQRPICATEVGWAERVKTETSQQSSAYHRGLLHRAGGRLAPARFASERWRSASRRVPRPMKPPRPTGITRLGSTDQQELHRPTGCPRPTSILASRFPFLPSRSSLVF